MTNRDRHDLADHPVDKLLIGISRMMNAARHVHSDTHTVTRDFPAHDEGDGAEHDLTDTDRRRAGRYMRVNHVGEVCAQALYRSQALTARDSRIRERMTRAADEENDHLAWCEQRMTELGARKSLLNPLWRAGAFALGGIAGVAGDKWSLGFVAETERQVVAHLQTHLEKLPADDARSRALLAQMQADEQRHADAAVEAGAAELPPPMKTAMRAAAKVMTTTAHWI